jgi:hypothetical protein
VADLTIGEIGKQLKFSLVTTDYTQSPPAQIPLDLTTATSVQLLYAITNPTNPPKAPTTKSMVVGSPPTSGVVTYTFGAGDLTQPPEMGKNGVFRFAIKVNFPASVLLYSNFDGQLSIKEDVTL